MKVAFVTGVTGQDGSYLAELLLSKDYDVYGLTRYCSEQKHERLVEAKKSPRFNIVYGDLTDTNRIATIIKSFEGYDSVEVYNLGAQSHVKVSFDQPEYTANVDALGTLRLLEGIRNSGFQERVRFYQAGTSEMFGKVQSPIQSETTPFYPRSPYGVSKLFGYWVTKNYRESYDMFACTGILFNHESERRGHDFVTRKITRGLSNYVKTGEQIELGNLDAQRDWGHAQDYVEAMWLMLQAQKPDDFVISTGRTHSIRAFVEVACKELGIAINWSGEGVDEVGKDALTGNVVVRVNPEFFRPAEVDVLIGNSTKAYQELNWYPKISFEQLVKRMVQHDK
jgi:GDPmannose 4,6-dehydratase